ncbi:MAG: sensor hybrid histidine kinase [Solirubrobacterales bacterium]|nr:sensor hybrid histidine kinase [Solirubrobacterales bacterium]
MWHPDADPRSLGLNYSLLARAAERTGLGCWIWNTADNSFHWSDTLYRLLGLTPREAEPSFRVFIDRVHPQDRALVQTAFERALTSLEFEPRALRVVWSDGQVRHLRTISRVDLGDDVDPSILVGVLQDVTEPTLASQAIAVHKAISEALVTPGGLGVGGRHLLRRLASALDFGVAELWLREGDELVRTGAVALPPATLPPTFVEPVRRPLRTGLVGRALTERRPLPLDSLPSAAWTNETRAAARAGMRGGIAIPALTPDDVPGVVLLRSPEPEQLPDALMHALVGVSYQLGAVLVRRRGELAPPLLTARELEVLELTATGRSGPAIAAHLTISPATVKTHLEHIYAKLGVPDRASAVARGLRDGMIP